MAPKIISVIGGLDYDLIMLADRIPNPGESLLANDYMEALGGKGANSAIASYRTCHKTPTERQKSDTESPDRPEKHKEFLSSSDLLVNGPDYGEDIYVRMIGAVGDDQYGERFHTELNKNGIDTSGIITVPNTRSSICFVMIDTQTRENRCLFTLGATVFWKKEHFLTVESLANGIRPDLVVAQMEIAKDVVEQMIETAGKAGIDFCLNAAPATPISKGLYRYVTHLLVNESEAAIMSGREVDEVDTDAWPIIAKEFMDLGAKNVISDYSW